MLFHKTNLFDVIVSFFIVFVIGGPARTNPIVHLGQLEFPKSPYFIGWHIALGNPGENRLSADSEI